MKIITNDEMPKLTLASRIMHVWIDSDDNWRVSAMIGLAETEYARFTGNTSRSRRMAAVVAVEYAHQAGINTILAEGLSITEWINKAIKAEEETWA